MEFRGTNEGESGYAAAEYIEIAIGKFEMIDWEKTNGVKPYEAIFINLKFLWYIFMIYVNLNFFLLY